MDISRLFAPLGIPQWQLQQLIEIDTWKARMVAYMNCPYEWLDALQTGIQTAAESSLAANWSFGQECMDRTEKMAALAAAQLVRFEHGEWWTLARRN